MDTHSFDVAVIGTGISGARAAGHLTANRGLPLIEAGEAAGHRSTGRDSFRTPPAAGRFVADLVSGRDPGQAASIIADVDPKRIEAHDLARITA